MYSHSQSSDIPQFYDTVFTFQQTSTDTDYIVSLTPHPFNTIDVVVTNITACLQITRQCGLAFSGVKCYGRCWLLEDGGHLPWKMLAITYK